MQIILVRHGKPDHDGALWCTPREMMRWVEGYQTADVICKKLPTDLVQLASTAGVLACSSLSRCIQSLTHLAGDRPYECDSVFAEAHLPGFALDWPRLPVRIWRLCLRTAWFLGLSVHTESVAVSNRRAKQAADRLIALAATHGSVLLMGHGIMNVLIARHLRAAGWVGPRHLILKDFWYPSVYTKSA
nr:histidine phosphatase family protein [Pseudomonas duriflava]